MPRLAKYELVVIGIWLVAGLLWLAQLLATHSDLRLFAVFAILVPAMLIGRRIFVGRL
jgi:hypothetical protein